MLLKLSKYAQKQKCDKLFRCKLFSFKKNFLLILFHPVKIFESDALILKQEAKSSMLPKITKIHKK